MYVCVHITDNLLAMGAWKSYAVLYIVAVLQRATGCLGNGDEIEEGLAVVYC